LVDRCFAQPRVAKIACVKGGAMPGARTRLLMLAATFLGGILPGSAVDRAIVGGPAWHELGAAAWLEYSRRADLGVGLVAYPIEGIGTAILTIAASASNYLDGNRRRRTVQPLYCAVGLSIVGLLLHGQGSTDRAEPFGASERDRYPACLR
jgi:hypothetical protein